MSKYQAPENKDVKSKKSDGELERRIAQMRLMQWTIQQIGNLDEAKIAFDLSYTVLKGASDGRLEITPGKPFSPDKADPDSHSGNDK